MAETRFPTVLSNVESLNDGWRDARLLTKQILTENYLYHDLNLHQVQK